ncbi:MAG: WYL domain-containing protein [Myxococcales bacterium]|nr:WYL domain-containing protein [Myxococcales bacterium]
MKRLERLLDLVHVLQTARAPVALPALREMFPDYADGSEDATRRKFERDKAELASIGLVLRYVADEDAEHGGEGGYWLDADASYLPPIELSGKDRALLASAARAALGSDTSPHRSALRLALAKLDADAEQDAPRAPRVMPARVSEEPVSAALEQLSDALARRKRVRLVYQKPDGPPTEREVDPYALFSKSGVWHLCGHDHFRATTRVFRVARIVSLSVNDKRPGQPDYSVPKGFRAADYSAMDPLRYEVHAPLVCRVRVDPEVAFLMRASWGEPDEEGVFTLTTSNLPHLLQQVLDLGARAELLAPDEAREAVARVLRAVLAAHEAEPAHQAETLHEAEPAREAERAHE